MRQVGMTTVSPAEALIRIRDYPGASLVDAGPMNVPEDRPLAGKSDYPAHGSSASNMPRAADGPALQDQLQRIALGR
jgi:hypothetical protein